MRKNILIYLIFLIPLYIFIQFTLIFILIPLKFLTLDFIDYPTHFPKSMVFTPLLLHDSQPCILVPQLKEDY